MSERPRILYCHCAYANVVPRETKEAVLRQLSDSGEAFDAVPDLCEMAARKDPSLQQLIGGDGESEQGCRIAACYPRAVRWLMYQAGVKWPEQGAEVHNMRDDDAAQIVEALLRPGDEPIAAGVGDVGGGDVGDDEQESA